MATYGKTGYTIEQAAEIMRAVVEHCVQGGSFRQFIYGRLDFDEAAYVPLCETGVMEFTNACPVNMDAEVAPSFAWAGAHDVLGVSDEHLIVEYETLMQQRREVEIFPGHSFQVGDKALIVYLSRRTSGQLYALECGKHYAAHQLAALLDAR